MAAHPSMSDSVNSLSISAVYHTANARWAEVDRNLSVHCVDPETSPRTIMFILEEQTQLRRDTTSEISAKSREVLKDRVSAGEILSVGLSIDVSVHETAVSFFPAALAEILLVARCACEHRPGGMDSVRTPFLRHIEVVHV